MPDNAKQTDNDASGEKPKPSSGKRQPPLWRLAFDLVERPVGAASEAWVQSDVFMDTLAASWKMQRRMTRRMQQGVGLWLDLMAVPRRSDVTALVNQVASLERQVRQVTRELERRNGTEVSSQRPAATTRRSSAKGKGR
jgi:hypothetical protein